MLKKFFRKKKEEIKIPHSKTEKYTIDNGFNYTSDLYKKNSRYRDTGFLGYVLLNDTTFDFKEFAEDLSNVWFIHMDDNTNNDGIHVFNVGNFIVNISKVKSPIPSLEIQTAAAKNYTWPESINETKEHKAHLIVSVIGEGSSYEKGKLFAKLIETCCSQKNVSGVYTNGTVYKPDVYKEFADIMEVDDSPLPVLNLVWIGFARSEKGFNAYTTGLQAFQKEELEILDTEQNLNIIHGVMLDMVNYILENDLHIEDGETIEFNSYQSWGFTRSPGVVCKGTTLKVDLK